MHTYQAISHQRKLLTTTLWLVFTLSAVIGSINVITFNELKLASFNYTTVILTGLVLWHFYRHQNMQVSSWALMLTVIFNLSMFIYFTQGQAYSLIWLTVLAPLAFFLLGRKAASWLVGLVFIAAVTYVALNLSTSPSRPITLGALLNVAEVFVVLWFLFRFYERTRQDAYSELEKISNTDRLTGLNNRGRLDDLLEYHIQLQSRTSEPLSIVLADIDNFKAINDQFGHLEGDRVLRQASEILRKGVRETDIIGRWGGEEFLLICPNTSLKGASTLAAKLKDKISSTLNSNNKEPVTLSFGVVTFKLTDSQTQLVSRADKALYEAKEQGRNLVITKP